MNPLRHTFFKLRVWVVFLLISVFVFSCTKNTDSESQIEKNEIWDLINNIRKENITKSKKSHKYDSLYSVINKLDEDTLKKKYLLRLAVGYNESGGLEKFFTINKEVRGLATRIQDSLGIGQAYYNIGLYYALTDKIDSAYVYYYKSSKLYTRFGNNLRLGRAYLAMGIMQKHVRDFVGAESNTIKAIHHLEKVENMRYLASSYNNLGLISRQLGNHGEAIKNLEKAFELREKYKKNTIVNASTLNNLGLIYIDENDFSKAIDFFSKGLVYDSLQYKRPETYAHLLDNLTYARFLSGEKANYPALFRKPLRICDSLNDLIGQASSTGRIAEYYFKNEELDSANYYSKNALRISKSMPYNRGVLESLLLLTEINEPKEALGYSKEYIRITDSLQKAEKRFQDQFARIRFGAEELEQENVKVSKQRAWLFNVVIGMGVLGVLGYIVYYQRKLKYQYKASNLEQRLLRSQLNPHFLFNALNSVSGLVQKKSDETIPYISKLGELLRSILENSREEFISLEEELDTIATYLELQSNFSKKFAFDIQVGKDLNKEELLIPPMFLQPFIENAIDHGFKGHEDEKITITVVQKSKDQVLYFSIEDNGIGYSNTMKNKKHAFGHQSLSGTILKERLELYARTFKKKARYVIEDVASNGGTRVHLYLPYLLDV